MPSTNMECILRLQFSDLEEDMEFPVIWFSAAFLLAIWEKRIASSQIKTYDIRSEIEGKVALLRETRHRVHITCLTDLCSSLV